MDMYQKRKIRAEKKKNNSQNNSSKLVLSWFPRAHEQNDEANRRGFKTS